MKKRKHYIPKSRHNPENIARQLDELRCKVENHRRELEIVTKSYDMHMEHLSNFAKHDMGNAIQGLYATIKLIQKELDNDNYTALKTSIDNIQSTLTNFEKLVPYTKTGTFELAKLIQALEILVRSSCSLEQIHLTFEYDRHSKLNINQPFQAILQLLHNLILNSIKALKTVNEEKNILVEAVVEDDSCYISVKDNGSGISDEHINKIFDYKFTTHENGSGIGLYHAKYVCNKIGGDILLKRNENGFTTLFTLIFPINGNKKDFNN